jgi:CBS domain-containing protein
MLAKDFMQADVFHIGSQTTLLEAAETPLTRRVDTLLILNGDELCGGISLRDLFTVPILADYGNPLVRHHNGAQLLNTWKTMQIQDLMNEKVIAVSEETTLLSAAELIVPSGKHPLPVLRNGKVVGIICRSDITRTLQGEA